MKSPSDSNYPDERDDQTLFMNQEPWLEDGTSQTKPKLPAATEAVPPATKRKNFLLLGAVASGFLIILALVLAVLTNQQQEVIEPSPTPEASSRPTELD